MRKKKKNLDNAPGRDVGAVMTVSLFLILLTFFILLNSMATIDKAKSIEAIGSLLGAFGNLPGGLSASHEGESIGPPSDPMIKDQLSLDRIISLMDKKMGDKVSLEKLTDKEIITINDEFLFKEDKLKLNPSSYPLLNILCNLIRGQDYHVEIVGHTDYIPAEEKGYKTNWELSTLKAFEILKYFLEKGKIPPGRLTAYGCGAFKPIASNDTRRSRVQNKRVEIILNFEAPVYFKRIHRKKSTGFFTYMNFDFNIFK